MRADKIWFNAAIQTLDPSLPTATALASKDGKIVAMGQDADVLHLGGPGTQSIDLRGRAVLPGFVESHTHALWGACQDLFEVNVDYGAAYGELIGAVKEHVARSSGDAMITGGPWRHDMRTEMGANPRATLDEISTDVPIALADVTKHLLWCNSRALALAGLHDEVDDIEGGISSVTQSVARPTVSWPKQPVRRCDGCSPTRPKNWPARPAILLSVSTGWASPRSKSRWRLSPI